MSICPNCKGTGVAPLKLVQECVGCQRKMTVTFKAHEDLTRHDGVVYCSDCTKARGDL